MITSNSVQPFIKIFGPCSAETRTQVLTSASQIAQSHPEAIFRAGIWKPRTRPGSFEGLGEQALPWLNEVQKSLGLRIVTEVATPAHLEAVLKAGIDMIWIGARTTVNPFSVQELAEALKGVQIPVFVKNPINPDVALWRGAIERIQGAGISEVIAIHRGFHSFEDSPYRNSPRWELVIDFKTQVPEIPMVCDVSHISGIPELIPGVAQKAMDLDYQGLMVEVHVEPEKALSDAKQQITPKQLDQLIHNLVFRSAEIQSQPALKKLIELRARVDYADDELMQSLITRSRLVQEIGQHKKEHDITILQLKRWEEVLERQMSHAQSSGLDPNFIKQLYELIHAESIRIQHKILNTRG